MKIFCSEIRKTERIVILDEQIQFFMPKKGYLQQFDIWTLLFKNSNNIWSSKSERIYSRDHKFVVFCFALLLPQILDYFQNQGQFWNLLVLTISKHPLLVQFDQVLAEIFEVKDTWYHFLILMTMDLTERKIIEIWTFCVKSNW